MKLLSYKNTLLFTILTFYSLSFSKCIRKKHEHVEPIVCRCTYTQQDIQTALKEQKNRYKSCCREKKCFYCKCPISDHTQ